MPLYEARYYPVCKVHVIMLLHINFNYTEYLLVQSNPAFWPVRQVNDLLKQKAEVKALVLDLGFYDTLVLLLFSSDDFLHVFYHKIIVSPFYGSMGPLQPAITRTLLSVHKIM